MTTLVKSEISNNNDVKHYLYMSMVDILRTQSNCLGSKFGCIIVNPHTNGSMYMGYNGSSCDDSKDCNCQRCIKRSKGEIKSGERLEDCVCVHAEPRALMWVPTDYFGSKLLNMYIQSLPCIDCANQIVERGYVGNIYVYDDYGVDKEKTARVKELFSNNGINVHYVNYSQVSNFKWQSSKL